MVNKKIVLVIVTVGLLFVVTSITIFLLAKNNEGRFEHDGIIYDKSEERWINCQPSPDYTGPNPDIKRRLEDGKELCRKAFGANYPYISQ